MLSRTINLYKKSFAGLSKEIWLLALLQLINRSGTMVVPFMSMYMTQQLGVSKTAAGFVMSCFGVGAILGSLLGGKLTDRFGYHKVLKFSLILGGVFFICLGYIHQYMMICICSFVLAVVNEAFRPANIAAIGVFSNDENRTRSSSLVRLTINLGWAVGGSLAGWLAAKNYLYLFWVDGMTNLMAAVFVIMLLPNITHHIRSKQEVYTGNNSVWRDYYYLGFIALKFLYAMCFFQLFTTLPIFMKEDLKLTELQIGWTMSINGIMIVLFEMIIVYYLSQKNAIRTYITIGTILMGVSFAIFNILPFGAMQVALISTIIITIAEILTMPFMMTYMLNRSTDANRGQYGSLYAVAFGAGQIAGPFLGSMVADYFGFKPLWWIVLLFCVMVGLGYSLLFAKESSTVKESEV